MIQRLFYPVLALYLLLAIGSTDGCRSGKPMATLEFVGSVENDNVPLNDRLVIVHANGKEVGRSFSHLGKYEELSEVPDDGHFVVAIDNEYEVTRDELGLAGTGTSSRVNNLMKLQLGNSAYLNFGALPEGGYKLLPIADRKNLAYSVYVVAGERRYLPPELLDERNTTVLTKDRNLLVVSREKGVPVNVQDVIFEGPEEMVKVRDLEFPFDNCRGSKEVQQRYYKTEAYLHETTYEQEASVKARVPLAWLAGLDISAQLKSKYGFYQKEMGQETIEYLFRVPRNQNVTYRITWYEVWQKGRAKVKTENGLLDVPFRVKTRMKYDITSDRERCG